MKIQPTYKLTFIIALLFIAVAVQAQSEAKQVRNGNKEYNKSNFKDAEIDYRKALEKMPLSYRALYNLGDALYQQGSYEESANAFLDLTQKQTGDDLKSKAFYNLGNSKLQHALKSDTLQPPQKVQKLTESIEAYKNSLKINPNDKDAKYNLTYAKKKLAEYEMQCQQQCQNKENQDQENKDEQDQQEQEQQNQDNQDQQQEQEKQAQQGEESKEISKDEAERMLEAMKNEEKNTMEKVEKKKVKTTKTNIEKDW